MLGVIGALEYDPDFPRLKANHRSYFAGDAFFKEVVPIHDEDIRFKIKQTYRLQFLKDVLARLLDDSTFSVFTSMIYFNQMSIVIALQNSQEYMASLFAIYKSPSSIEQRRDGVKFVHQISLATKGFQNQQKKLTFTKLIAHGLFLQLEFALNDTNDSIRMLGTELLLTIIDLDATLIRNYVQTPGQHAATFALMQTLVELFFRERDIGLKSQTVEALKYMLDVGTLSLQDDMERSSSQDLENDVFIASFYTNCAGKLFDCIRDVGLDNAVFLKPLHLSTKAMYEILCDLLNFCVKMHGVKCRTFTIERGIWPGIAALILCPHQVIQLAALRCLKQALLLDDTTYMHYFTKASVFEAVVDVLVRMGNKNNLVNSACLEVLSLIENGGKLSVSESMMLVVNSLATSRQLELKDGLSYSDLGGKLLTLHGRFLEEEALYAQQMLDEQHLQEEAVADDEPALLLSKAPVEEAAPTTDVSSDNDNEENEAGRLKRRVRDEEYPEHEEGSPLRRLRIESKTNSDPELANLANTESPVKSATTKSEPTKDENATPEIPSKEKRSRTRDEKRKLFPSLSNKRTGNPSTKIGSTLQSGSATENASASKPTSPTKKDKDPGSIRKTLVNTGKLVLGGLKKGSAKTTSPASPTRK